MKHRSIFHLFSFLSVLLAVSLACKVFTPSATQPPINNNPPVNNTPVDTPSNPTEPPTAPPTIAPTEAPVQPVEQYFTEEFDTNPSSWSQEVELNSTKGDKSQALVDVKDGFLTFDLGKWLIAYMFYDGAEYDNVRIDARVDNRGTNVNDVLLVCRVSDEGHYLVNVANSGLFAMYAYDGVKQTYARMSNGGSKKIKSGKETNDYSLVCSDRTIILYVNGVEARRYTDNQFAFRKGKIGVGVASEDQIPVKIDFQWVKISQP